MVDTYSIQQSTGKGYVDGAEVETWVELFTTPGYVKVRGVEASGTAEVGARTADEVVRYLNIPATAPKIPPGRVSAVPLSLDDTTDPTLMGARMILGASHPTSHANRRQIRVTEVTS